MKVAAGTLLVLVLLSGAMFAPAAAERVVVAEMFTATWCSYCAKAEPALDRLADEQSDLAVLMYHPDDGRDDLGTDDLDKRKAIYDDVDGYPTTFFDGVERIGGGYDGIYDDYKAAFKGREDRKTSAEIDLRFRLKSQDTKGKVNLSVEATKELPDNTSLLVVLYEDNVKHSGSNGLSKYRFTVRDILIQKQLTIAKGESYDREKLFDLDPAWEASELGVVAFIQDGETAEILQGARDTLTPSGGGDGDNSNTDVGASDDEGTSKAMLIGIIIVLAAIAVAMLLMPPKNAGKNKKRSKGARRKGPKARPNHGKRSNGVRGRRGHPPRKR